MMQPHPMRRYPHRAALTEALTEAIARFHADLRRLARTVLRGELDSLLLTLEPTLPVAGMRAEQTIAVRTRKPAAAVARTRKPAAAATRTRKPAAAALPSTTPTPAGPSTTPTPGPRAELAAAAAVGSHATPAAAGPRAELAVAGPHAEPVAAATTPEKQEEHTRTGADERAQRREERKESARTRREAAGTRVEPAAAVARAREEPTTEEPMTTAVHEEPPRAEETHRGMQRGTVKWFSDAKGYGFVRADDGTEAFVHYSSISSEGFRTLSEGQAVSYDEVQSSKGLLAVNVVPAGPEVAR